MSYSTGRAFRQALESRLRMHSVQTATPLVRLLQLGGLHLVSPPLPAEPTQAPAPTQATVRRFPTHSLLDGRTFENFHVDVGVGDPVIGAAEVLVLPPVLA